MPKCALVVSGGGAKGAYAVGAVDYLVNRKGINFEVVCGTSTGALIAPMVVADEIATLVHVYSNVSTRDIVKAKSGVGNILRSSSIYNIEPVVNLIAGFVTDQLTAKIVGSQTRQMFLTTVGLQEGVTVYFASGPAAAANPHMRIERITDRSTLIRAMTASASVPVFMPPIPIPKNQTPPREYLDGGVQEAAPMRIAVDQGIDELYVVVLSPRIHAVDDKKFTTVAAILMRTIDLMYREVMRNDIENTQEYSDALAYIDAVRNAVKAQTGLNTAAVDALFKPAGVPNPFTGRRPVRIHVIQPDHKDEIPLSTLDFNKTEMRKMIERGREKAEEVVPL